MRRELAKWAEEAYELTQRGAARLIDMPRMTLRYEPHRDPQDAFRARLRELAGIRVRYGYRRLTVSTLTMNHDDLALGVRTP